MLYYQYDPEKKEIAFCFSYIFNSKNSGNSFDLVRKVLVLFMQSSPQNILFN